MTLDELQTLCLRARYTFDPPSNQQERESEALNLVVKLIAVVRAVKAYDENLNHWGDVQAALEALE